MYKDMNRLITLLLILCLPFGLFGQGFTGGAIVGFNASQVDGDNFGGYKKLGYALGLFANYKFNDLLAIQPEIMIEQLGSREVEAAGVPFAARLVYVSANPLLNLNRELNVGGEYNHAIQFFAGPAFGYLLSAKDFGKQEVTDIRNTDIKVLAGFGYKFGRRLAITSRYGYSIRSFEKFPAGSAAVIGNGWYNHYIQIALQFHILGS